MSVRRPLCAIAATAALAGCFAEQEPLAPPITAPALALASAQETAAAQYLVTFKGKGIPSSFRAEVAGAGGEIVFAHEAFGLALVRGLDEAGVAALGAARSVSEVIADQELQLLPQQETLEAVVEDAIESHVEPTAARRYAYQWNMRAINAPAAWAAGKVGSPGVTVAILDTGIDYDNPDLNGLVDLSRSASFVPGDAAYGTLLLPTFGTRHPITDYHGHGTNVATQVASNAWAFAGVTSHTTLIGVKVLGARGNGSTAGVLFGILHAADQGADIINMSLGSLWLKAGGGGQTRALYNQVMQYAQQAGSLVVVSAGNDAIDLDHDLVPDDAGVYGHFASLVNNYCDAVHVVCVSSVGPLTPDGYVDEPAWYSDFGRSAIDVAGPGGNYGAGNSAWPWGNSAGSFVWAICPKTRLTFNAEGNPTSLPCHNPGFVYFSGSIGTSQAAPHVAGVAALIAAEGGTRNAQQLKQAVVKAAVDLGQTGTDPSYGKGRIDVARALGL